MNIDFDAKIEASLLHLGLSFIQLGAHLRAVKMTTEPDPALVDQNPPWACYQTRDPGPKKIHATELAEWKDEFYIHPPAAARRDRKPPKNLDAYRGGSLKG